MSINKYQNSCLKHIPRDILRLETELNKLSIMPCQVLSNLASYYNVLKLKYSVCQNSKLIVGFYEVFINVVKQKIETAEVK